MSELSDWQLQYIKQLEIEEKEELDQNIDLIEAFKKECRKKGVILEASNFKYIRTIGIVACYPNIVGLLCPNVCKDKEGLLDFKSLCEYFGVN